MTYLLLPKQNRLHLKNGCAPERKIPSELFQHDCGVRACGHLFKGTSKKP